MITLDTVSGIITSQIMLTSRVPSVLRHKSAVRICGQVRSPDCCQSLLFRRHNWHLGSSQRRTTLLSTLKKSAVKNDAGFDHMSELNASIQTAENSQQENLDVLFAEPEVLQALSQLNG